MKRMRQTLAYFLAMTMLLTNVNYVSAASAPATDISMGDISGDDVSQNDVSEGNVSQKDVSESDVSGEIISGEQPMSVNSTETAEEVTVLHSGKQFGVTWKITSDGVLTISGKKTTGNTTAVPTKWRDYYDEFTKVVITAENIHSTNGWFWWCDITEVDMTGFDTSTVEDMGGMFWQCSKLTGIDLSNVDTSKVEDMSYMFDGCTNLTSLDVSGFDTSNVVNMQNMFAGCKKLTSLNLNNLDTSKVTNMSGMFKNCSQMTALDLSGFKTSNVTTMNNMFSGMTNLTTLKLTGFDTSNVTDMGRMFASCQGLTSLDLSDFKTSKVTTIYGMFAECGNLVSLDISGFDTSSVTGTMSDMFKECKKLTTLNLAHFDTSKVIGFASMFYDCESLTTLDVSKFNTSSATDMSEMFAECKSLTALDVSGFVTSKVTDMSYMFMGCGKVTSLDVSGFDTSKVKNMCYMFSSCGAVTALDVANFDTSNATDMKYMFYSCKTLTTLDVSKFKTSKVTDMKAMFEKCKGLTTLDVTGFDTSNAQDTLYMFRDCSSLTSLDLSNFDLSSFDPFWLQVNDETYMFTRCSAIDHIKTIPNLTFEIKLPVSPMYDAQYNAYTTFPMNLAQSIDLYALDKFTVTFDNGLGEDSLVEQEFFEGQTITLPEEPARTGYTFMGWYTGQDGTGTNITPESVVNEDLYLYAYWVPVELKLLTFEQAAYELMEKETMQAVPAFDPAEASISWTLEWTSSDTTVATVSKEGQVTAIRKGTTTITAVAGNGISAQYVLTVKPLPRTVTFDNGVSYTPTKITNIPDGTTITLPEEPTRKGYNFIGWFTEKDGNGIEFTAETVVEEDWYVYAYWIPDGLWATEVEAQTYTGKAIKPAIQVYEGDILLKEKVDYTISYKNNTNVSDASDDKKAPTIIVKGKGNYKDKETITFEILAKNIGDEDVTVADLVKAASNKTQKPVPVVTYNGKKLKNNKDFTVSYPSAGKDAYKVPGSYIIKVTGKGNFKGERNVAFVITDSVLMSKTKIVAVSSQTYTGNAIEPELTVTYKGETLIKGTDYTVEYRNNVAIGKATAVVTGMDKYAGTKTVNFQIMGQSITNAEVTGIEDKTYNGQEQVQKITVMLDGKTLKADTDYDVSYSKNINAGTANMVITGKGHYSGTIKKSFKINAYDLAADSAKLLKGIPQNLKVYYTKGGSTPTVELTLGGAKLAVKKDYIISYKNNKKTALSTDQKAPTITLKGKGNFKGTIEIKFTIAAKSLKDNENPVAISVPDIAYNAKAGKFMSKPVLTDSNGKKLAAGTDYDKDIVYTKADGTTLTKTDTPQVGDVIKVTVTGKGNYTDTIEATYKITQASFKSAKIKVDAQVYTGKAVTLDAEDFTVKIGNTELKYGEDYEIVEGSYQNNVKKGTASVTIKGIGNYGGKKTVKFKIVSKEFVWFWNLF